MLVRTIRKTMQNELMGKEELRAHYRQLRDSLPEESRWSSDELITDRFLELKAYQNAELILTYLSVESEVETRGIIQRAWEDGKAVALPRCVPSTNKMEWYLVESLDNLVETAMGIWEPLPDQDKFIDATKVKHALCVVPGLVFDRVGYRIGYGGGFYDVFLADFFGITVGLCRDAFISERSLRFEEFDISVDMVLTETQIEGISFYGTGD